MRDCKGPGRADDNLEASEFDCAWRRHPKQSADLDGPTAGARSDLQDGMNEDTPLLPARLREPGGSKTVRRKRWRC